MIQFCKTCTIYVKLNLEKFAIYHFMIFCEIVAIKTREFLKCFIDFNFYNRMKIKRFEIPTQPTKKEFEPLIHFFSFLSI